MSLFIAHRGLSALAPENTAAAFDLAWAHDCDGIELDVQVTRDGQVVVHHDADLKRTAKLECAIADEEYAALREHDIGSHFDTKFADQRMSLLDEVLTAMPADKLIQVEVKPEVTRVDEVIAVLREARQDAKIYVMSFDPEQLSKLHAGLPNLPTLWIVDEDDARDVKALCERALEAGFTGIDVHQAVIDAAYVERVHEAGLLLGCWTVNDPARMRELAGWGVDMIASDCAHLAKA
ncbi:hypothetical protein KRX19_04980 [Cardiobacteriaceae bacterium TAE3-ERU3]|nr:hypothetical protein [Cardiobacteriaceae bacterium TAE3-ERU3]